jgi:hypothetical protein
MRLSILVVLVAFAVAAPRDAEAQPHLMGGVGISTPLGDFADAASVGWHAMAGLQLEVTTIPIALRADGGYHSFGESSGAPKASMLTGALSAVVNLPGVGLVPYLAAGIGTYRTSIDGSDASSDRGFHGAFGVNIGAAGFGGFAEARLVQVDGAGGASRFVTATVGFRL